MSPIVEVLYWWTVFFGALNTAMIPAWVFGPRDWFPRHEVGIAVVCHLIGAVVCHLIGAAFCFSLVIRA